LAIKPKPGILAILICKPIIDTAYLQYIVFGVRLTEIACAGVIIIILARSLFESGEKSLFRTPLFFIWGIYLLWNLISSQIITYSYGVKGVDTFFRTLNGVLGIYWFQAYFSDKEDFKKLLIFLLLGGIFPIGIGMFQFITGYRWSVWLAEGGIRNIGLYHDQATLKYYLFQTIAASYLYGCYFAKKNIQKFLIGLYFICCIPVLYKLYVKSGNIALSIWVIIWAIIKKKYVALFTIIMIVLAVNLMLNNVIFNDLFNVYKKEINFIKGETKLEESFAGRWIGWKEFAKKWVSSGVGEQFFGTGETGYGSHNDYLYVISRSGFIGFIIYISLLLVVGIKILYNIKQNQTPLCIISLLVYILWHIECIGLVPSGYSSFQWFVWGFIGLSLKIAKSKNAVF
jgi:O-antigen ligase